MNDFGIYVHIPFCESKCIYCDFASFVSGEKEKYFKCLLDEIKRSEYYGEKVTSIYIGGGTPSSVDSKYIGQILQAIKDKFNLSETAEISIECNPGSQSKEKLKDYQSFGINRISYGVQSLSGEVLKFLGRRHDRNLAVEAVSNAKTLGFEGINVDLLIGLPNVSNAQIIEDAKTLIDAGANHISAYMLQLEQGTKLYKLVETGLALPSEDESISQYDALCKFLQDNGFERYEISNFAKPSKECKHNLLYWQGQEYLGFGLSASSYYKGQRWTNGKIFDHYYNGKLFEKEILTKNQQIEEKIMLGLRCKCGFSINVLKELGYEIEKNPNFAKFKNEKILLLNSDIVTLNPDYYGVSNNIIVKLLP